jgi:hypothetical protein
MPLIRQGQPRPDEGNEVALAGPFGGIQSEAPLSRIEGLGVQDATNVLFRKGAMQVRPVLNATSSPDGTAIMGIFDFFDRVGTRHQMLFTTRNLFEWNSNTQTWVEIPPGGAAGNGATTFSGTNTNKFSATIVNGQLVFSNGVDPIGIWDGSAAFWSNASVSTTGRFPARYLFELDTYALALYTTEAGNTWPQRVHWSAPGDPTIWEQSPTEFRPGITDLLNDLGPITGGVKLYQSGFVFHYWGITQVVPTGIGLAPFDFVPLSSRAKGNVIPFSLSDFGEDIACYVGKDNVYQFDGNYSVPIGDARIDGTRYRIGARKRILADLVHADFATVNGFITTSISGNDYFAYWLFIPNLDQAWVYHFDEQSWTRETFTTGTAPISSGSFFNATGLRIMDLLGTIGHLPGIIADLGVNTIPFDGMLIGGQNGIPNFIDFTGASERPWTVMSGNHYFGDFRRRKTVSTVRLMLQDFVANQTATLTLTSNTGVTQTQPVGPVGTGSGNDITVIIPFQPVVSGTWIRWQLQGNANSPFYLTELTPYYDIGGQIRAGGVD